MRGRRWSPQYLAVPLDNHDPDSCLRLARCLRFDQQRSHATGQSPIENRHGASRQVFELLTKEGADKSAVPFSPTCALETQSTCSWAASLFIRSQLRADTLRRVAPEWAALGRPVLVSTTSRSGSKTWAGSQWLYDHRWIYPLRASLVVWAKRPSGESWTGSFAVGGDEVGWQEWASSFGDPSRIGQPRRLRPQDLRSALVWKSRYGIDARMGMRPSHNAIYREFQASNAQQADSRRRNPRVFIYGTGMARVGGGTSGSLGTQHSSSVRAPSRLELAPFFLGMPRHAHFLEVLHDTGWSLAS